MTVHVNDLSESGDTITTLKLNPNIKIKHVKEQIEANTGIGKATQCLLHRFHNGKEEQLWQLNDNGKLSSYYIKDGSILVFRCKRSTDTRIGKVFGVKHGPTPFGKHGQLGIRRKTKHGPAKQRVAAMQRVAALALSESNTLSAPLEP